MFTLNMNGIEGLIDQNEMKYNFLFSMSDSEMSVIL